MISSAQPELKAIHHLARYELLRPATLRSEFPTLSHKSLLLTLHLSNLLFESGEVH
jgi:hypothetical protein